MRRVHVVVAGRVQGVFFRAGCAERARAAGVAGWIRNTEDGRVEAVFEGPAVAVETHGALVPGGPSARPRGVGGVREEPLAGETGFRVSR